VRGAHLESEETDRDALEILRCKNEHRNDENYYYSQIDQRTMYLSKREIMMANSMRLQRAGLTKLPLSSTSWLGL
jgi:hypothetical protein